MIIENDSQMVKSSYKHQEERRNAKMNSNILRKTLLAISVTSLLIPATSTIINTPIENVSHASELELTKDEFQNRWDKYNKGNPLDLPQEYLSRIKDTNEYPYQSVGSIFIKGKTVATASVVGKNKIITNFHVAREAAKDPSKVLFRPGMTKEELGGEVKLPYGVFEAESIKEAPFGEGVDLAVITLKPNGEGKNIGDIVKPLEFGNGDAIDPNQSLKLIGYPYNTVQDTMHKHKIEVYSTNRGLEYFGYTEAGNSGSPILDDDNNIVGMHVGKAGIKDRGDILTGIRFDSNFMKFLKKEIQ
uniref:Serine protease n=1 Tax=Staphylococcus hyicus TaxID=1284 RepID=Q8GNJ6_STAHY|nr:exfoliative toxin ExhB [Staphylococcus hyicus]ALN39179.1 ExhB [Staphylococcus hyicus]